MNPKRQPSPSIVHPIGTYVIDNYADGSLELNKIIGGVIHFGDGYWHVEADYPQHHTGKLFISSSAYPGYRKALNKDFKAFIIEQKQSLIDLKKKYKKSIQDMNPWFEQGAETGYEWWQDYRKRKGLQPPPPFETIVPAGTKSI